MEENLVGYLLKALDPEAEREVEVLLRKDAQARDNLELLRSALAPLAVDAGAEDPPAGLATETIARIAEHRCRVLPMAPRVSAHQPGAPSRRWWPPRIDVVAAAGVLIVLGGLLTPMAVQQWSKYQVHACQNNMRLLYTGLKSYSDEHEGAFPHLEDGEGPHSMPGIFVPVLYEANVLNHKISVGCPAQGNRPFSRLTPADLRSLYQQDPARYQSVAADLAGDYAYPLGYREKGQLCGLRFDSGGHLPLLADRPPAEPDRGNSPNHDGQGQNVLFVDGHVGFHPNRRVGTDEDIFLNREKLPAAGLDLQDSVLRPSNDVCPDK